MEPTLKRFAFNAMGTSCEIQLFDESRINAKQLTRKMAEEVNRLEKKYSRYRRDSLLTEINFSAGEDRGIKIDTETRGLFNHALNCYEQSEGLFDITAGRLSRLWDFRKAEVPTPAAISEAQRHCGFHRLSWSGSRLKVPAGMEIDFGGIVKEYAADTIAKLARSLGTQRGLVNLGGDFAVIGPQPDNKPWPIGIADPNNPRQMIATIDLHDGGLASSGDYQRFFEHEGKRYSHLINPKTGWPSEGLRAVSVAANLCTVAGSMATIAMLKAPADAQSWLLDTGAPYLTMAQDGSLAGSALPGGDQQDNRETQADSVGEPG